MNMKRIFALAFAVLMVLALAACGTKNNDKMGDMSGNGSAMTGEPKTAEEALALHKELLEQENALLSENAELWEKVFMAADKGMTMQEVVDLLRDEHGWSDSVSNLSNKLQRESLRYVEAVQLADALGFEIVWQRRK